LYTRYKKCKVINIADKLCELFAFVNPSHLKDLYMSTISAPGLGDMIFLK